MSCLAKIEYLLNIYICSRVVFLKITVWISGKELDKKGLKSEALQDFFLKATSIKSDNVAVIYDFQILQGGVVKHLRWGENICVESMSTNKIFFRNC